MPLKKDYNYEELLNILSNIHTQPAFDNLKEYIDPNRSKFSPDQYEKLQDMVHNREAYFNPKNCNSIKEIRLYYRDNQGHEFSNAYSGEKGRALCREAKDTGMSLPQYINFLGAGSNDGYTFQGWTIDASGSYNRTYQPANEVRIQRMPQEQEEQYYSGRKLRRNINEEIKREHETEIQINTADLIRQLKSELSELINESRIENQKRIEELRNEIRYLSRGEETSNTQPQVPEPKIIREALSGQQYRYFLSNAYKLGLPVKYQMLAKGRYAVSIEVNNPEEEQRVKNFIDEKIKYENTNKTPPKTHLEGYNEILNQLCARYVKESGIPCGLSRTGALSTLADRLLEYAKSQGIDWQVLYDIHSMNLFAKRGKIYTSEQADEAFNNYITQITGERMSKRIETKQETCSSEIIMASILDYDSISAFKSQYPQIAEAKLNKDLNDAIVSLSECGYYPERLEDARAIAEGEFSHYGTSYLEEVDNAVKKLIRRYANED